MENPTKEFLEEYARVLLQKNYEGLYACGGGQKLQVAKLKGITRLDILEN